MSLKSWAAGIVAKLGHKPTPLAPLHSAPLTPPVAEIEPPAQADLAIPPIHVDPAPVVHAPVLVDVALVLQPAPAPPAAPVQSLTAKEDIMDLVDTIKQDGAIALHDTLAFIQKVAPNLEASILSNAKAALATAETALVPVMDAAADSLVAEILAKIPGATAVGQETGLTSEGITLLNSVIAKLAAKLPTLVPAGA